MLKTKHNIVAIGILGIALAIVIVVIGSISWGRRAAAPVTQTGGNNPTGIATSTESSTTARKFTPHPPHGSVTYQIAEAATQLPGFVQATIDPADVHVGQVQHFMIVTSDPNPITSVVAVITTDHKTVTVPLVSQGVPATSMLVPRTVTVDADNRLALVDPGTNGTGNLAAANTEAGAHVANAATANETAFTGQWTVEDTHTAKYRTVFTAKDSAGNENSVTLEWTDPCPFASNNNYGGVSYTLGITCDISTNVSGVSSVDGPEHGGLVLGTGGSLTIGGGAKLVINANYDIRFSGGKILIPSNGQIVFGQEMCGTDNDGDGYRGSTDWMAAANCGGMVPRSSISGGSSDCNDGDGNAHPGQNNFFGSSEVGTPGPGGAYDYDCDGTATQQYTDTGGTWPINACIYNGSPCADLVVNAWAGDIIPDCGAFASWVQQGTRTICSGGNGCYGTARGNKAQSCK